MDHEVDFDDPKIRERLCIMDGRLETVFARPVRKRKIELKPLPTQANNKELHIKHFKRKEWKNANIQDALNILDISMLKAKHSSIPSPSKMGRSVVRDWLLSMASGEQDPIQVARECLEVSQAEFEESQKFMKQELRFIHAVNSGQSPLLRQAAESCLIREQHIDNVWKGFQLVFAQLLDAYSSDREAFALQTNNYDFNTLKRKCKKLNQNLVKMEIENENLQEELKQTKKFLNELVAFNKSGKVMEYDFSLLGDASGVDKKLQQIYDDMMKIPKRLRFSTKEFDDKETSNSCGNLSTSIYDEGNICNRNESIQPENDERMRVDTHRNKTQNELQAEYHLEQLDKYELSSALARTLGKRGTDTIQCLLHDLDPTVKTTMIGALLTAIIEGDGDTGLKELMANLAGKGSKSTFLKKFLDVTTDDERKELVESMLVDCGFSDKELGHLATQLTDKMTKPFVPQFVIKLNDNYIKQCDRDKLIDTLNNGKNYTDFQSKAVQTIVSVDHQNLTVKDYIETVEESRDSKNSIQMLDKEDVTDRSSAASNGEKIMATQIDFNFSETNIQSRATGTEVEPPLWRNRPLPWERYMGKPPKKIRIKTFEIRLVNEALIGDIYLKKIMSNRDIQNTGRRKDLTSVVLHYFTQKYGLKKMAEEYIYSLIKLIRDNNHNSKRLRTFGRLVGILNPETYSPMLCEVVVELLSVVYTPGQVAGMLSNGNATYALKQDVSRAIRAVFSIGSQDSPGKQSEVVKQWSIPSSLRLQLLRWVDANSPLVSDLKNEDGSPVKRTNVGSGPVAVVHLDDFLEVIVEIFIKKLLFDRNMLMNLFSKFDKDGNGVLTYDKFAQLLEECQPVPALSEAEILELWDEVNGMDNDDDDDTITKESFASVVVNRGFPLPYWNLSNEMDGRLSVSTPEKSASRS